MVKQDTHINVQTAKTSTGYTTTSVLSFGDIGISTLKNDNFDETYIFDEEYLEDESSNINKTNSQLIRFIDDDILIGKEIIGNVNNPVDSITIDTSYIGYPFPVECLMCSHMEKKDMRDEIIIKKAKDALEEK